MWLTVSLNGNTYLGTNQKRGSNNALNLCGRSSASHLTYWFQIQAAFLQFLYRSKESMQLSANCCIRYPAGSFDSK